MSSEDMTAAHPSLPFGTEVEVENLDNGRKVTVRVNDRGSFVAERIIDVSKAAAESLGMIVAGLQQSGSALGQIQLSDHFLRHGECSSSSVAPLASLTAVNRNLLPNLIVPFDFIRKLILRRIGLGAPRSRPRE